jgi:hypothetical protein
MLKDECGTLKSDFAYSIQHSSFSIPHLIAAPAGR